MDSWPERRRTHQKSTALLLLTRNGTWTAPPACLRVGSVPESLLRAAELLRIKQFG